MLFFRRIWVGLKYFIVMKDGGSRGAAAADAE